MEGNLLKSVLVILVISIAWTTVAQFGKQSFVLPPEEFFAPFFIIYLMHLSGALVYPIYLFLRMCLCDRNIVKHLKEATDIYKVEKTDVFFSSKIIKNVVYMALPMMMLTFILQYAYAQSLRYITAAVAASVMSTNAALVCILGWVFLKEKVSVVKTLGVIFAVLGVIVMSTNESTEATDDNMGILGVFLVVLSAVAAAVYNVTFKLIYGHPSVNQVAFYTFVIATLNFIINSIPLYLLITFDYDHIVWEKVPWLPIAAYVVSSVVFQFLVNIGISLLNPLVVSIGVLCALPMISAFDIVVRNEPTCWNFYIGVVLFMMAFVFSVFPLDLLFKKKETPNQPEAVALNQDIKE
ncbi:unnamed protein product [Bursaphelenchus okinawaensis]|uniref:EamA domain-containing protein n=1 Tax=Bursaphelenchus okinawaensis TaxID=465554 RepID=A0A811KZ64_9BILA|nr:unnamed protein product [Bursaphelenchus okinawaensis]CAG9113306.1 unnamed protein product [Bursaphelenchus okinawaensis]